VGGDHQELMAVWKEKWMQAKTNLELAIVHFSEIERMANFPQEHYQRCLEALAKAVNEYTSVFQIYTGLTLHGKIPDG
jgi:hypothetical protein